MHAPQSRPRLGRACIGWEAASVSHARRLRAGGAESEAQAAEPAIRHPCAAPLPPQAPRLVRCLLLLEPRWRRMLDSGVRQHGGGSA